MVQSRITRQSLLLLIAVALAALMDGLDGSIVNIALPLIAAEFGADTGSVSWTVIVYLLMVAGTILIFGNIAARGQVKKILITGFTIFTAASLVCGFSVSLPMLIIARLVQGLGATMIIACAPIICVKFMPPQILGLSFGVLTAATSVGFAVGPAVGGFLTHYLSWHWIFFINIPIGIFAVLYCLLVIPKETAKEDVPFDWIGAVLLFAVMASGVYVLERLPHLGWMNPQIIGFTLLFAAVLLAFCIIEIKSPHPLVNIRVFTRFRVNAVIISFFIIQIVYCGLLYLLPFYLTNTVRADSLTSGFYLLIPPLVTAILSVPISRWSDRTGRRSFMTASCVCLVLISIVFALIRPEWGVLPLLLSLLLMGLSIGFVSGPGSGRIVEVMPDGEQELGSTLMMTCVYCGGVVGTALYAAVFTLLTAEGGQILSFAELPPELFLSGFHLTMAAGILISAAAVILSAVVPDRKSV